jgi:glycerophosphoryl diester phosphodiesterase
MPAAPLVLAHRGACRRAPENTVDAFGLARGLGADGVELDVRRSADGVLVVHHDAHAEPIGLLAEVPFAAIRSARPEIPSLEEAFAACAGLIVNVEIKCLPWEPDADPDHVVVAAVVDMVREHSLDVVVSSFDLDAVDAVRARTHEVPTGYLVHNVDLATAAGLARERGHAWLHPSRAGLLEVPDAAEAVAMLHRHGLRVDVWTVDDPEEMRALATAGVDAIITNVPDVARAALS